MLLDWIRNWISGLALVASGPTTQISPIYSMLDLHDLRQVHQYAREILEQCPWPECQIVSLGPTNTLIDSFLRYYLGNKAEEAIHYVPLRGLRSAIQEPIWMERTLPPRSSPAKRILLVRTLEMGQSAIEYEEALGEYLEATGRDLKVAEYFMVGEFYQIMAGYLERSISWTGLDWKYPDWSRTLRPLHAGRRVIDRSYRVIDDYYYRYQFLSGADWGGGTLWRSPRRIPAMEELRQKLARSVGLDSTPGPKFDFDEEILADWSGHLQTHRSPDAALTAFGDYLRYILPSSSAFRQEMEQVVTDHFMNPEFKFTENPRYLELDRVIREFIETTDRFEAKRCGAIVTGAS